MNEKSCKLCDYKTDNIHIECCPICGTELETAILPINNKEKHVKMIIDDVLVENMIAYIKEQGETLVWNVLNQTKLEYRLDDLACFFEAKYRLEK